MLIKCFITVFTKATYWITSRTSFIIIFTKSLLLTSRISFSTVFTKPDAGTFISRKPLGGNWFTEEQAFTSKKIIMKCRGGCSGVDSPHF